MQLIESPVRASETTIAIGPSVAVELSWVLLAARRDQLCESQSALAAFYRGTGGLAERVRSFWPDRVADFGEELVLADEASVIGSVDIEELLTGIADAATRDLRKPRLASEDESDRAVFLARLDRLRRAARLLPARARRQEPMQTSTCDASFIETCYFAARSCRVLDLKG